jgi:predicted DNA-binding protein YlxM (UPF0122 family)
MESNACDYGIGVVLMQNGRPISFMSKALGPRFARHSNYDKEAPAILEALKKMEALVLNWSTKPGVHTRTKVNRSYSTQVVDKATRVQLHSRIQEGKGKKWLMSRVKHTIQSMFTTTAIPAWVNEVTKSYADDPKCKELIEKLIVAPTSITNYTYSKGLLRYKAKIHVGNNSELRNKIIDSLHNSELGGHSGEKATY